MLPDSPYGITKGLNGATTYLHPNVVTWSKSLGVTWFRLQLSMDLLWKNQSDPPANWNWNQLDDGISQLQTAGFRIVLPLRGWPSWCLKTASQQATRSSDHLGDWFLADPTLAAQIASAVASRYNGVNDCISNGTNYGKLTVHSIEVGNEEFNDHYIPSPTVSGGSVLAFGIRNSPYKVYNGLNGVSANVQPTRDPWFWVQVAQKCYSAIKTANPNCLVGQASIFWKYYPNYVAFMDGLYSNGGKDYCDYNNWHIYTGTLDPLALAANNTNQVPGFPDGWNVIQAAQKTWNDTGKPIWCTEFGWKVPDDVTASVQATNYQKVFDNAHKSGVVDKLFLYTIDDRTVDSNGAPLYDNNSIVQWGYGQATPTSYVFLPAYTTIQNYITANPTWGSSGGGGGGGGGSSVNAVDTMQNRTKSSGWGAASDGVSGSWVPTTEAGANTPSLSIDPTDGAVFTGSIGSIACVLLGSETFADGDVVVRLKVSVTGNNAGVVLRANAAGTAYYRASLSGGILELAYVNNGSTIDFYKSGQLGYLTTHYYYIRFRAIGTTLYGRYWDSGSTEPSDFTNSNYAFTYTLSGSDPVLTSGQFGLRARTAGNSAIINFDSFQATSNTSTPPPNTHALGVQNRTKFTTNETGTTGGGTPNVMLIAMENRAYSEITASSSAWTNVKQLMSSYANLTKFYATNHPSLPNYLAFMSGSDQGVTTDDTPANVGGPFAGPTFLDILSSATPAIPWNTYFESIPSTGYTGADTGNYAQRHNPFVYFNSFLNVPAKVNKLVGYTQSAVVNALNGSNPPNFVWITPNTSDDGHTPNTNDSTPDTFVGNLVTAVQATNWYKNNGTIIVWWDESHPDNANDPGIGDANPGGGQTGCIVISNFTKGYGSYTTPVNHFGILHTLCTLYGVSPLKNAKNTGNGNIDPLFTTGSNPTSHALYNHTQVKFKISGVGSTHVQSVQPRAPFKISKSLGVSPIVKFSILDKPLLQALMVFPGRDGVKPMKGRDAVMNIKGRDGVFSFKGRNGKSINFKGRGANR